MKHGNNPQLLHATHRWRVGLATSIHDFNRGTHVFTEPGVCRLRSFLNHIAANIAVTWKLWKALTHEWILFTSSQHWEFLLFSTLLLDPHQATSYCLIYSTGRSPPLKGCAAGQPWWEGSWPLQGSCCLPSTLTTPDDTDTGAARRKHMGRALGEEVASLCKLLCRQWPKWSSNVFHWKENPKGLKKAKWVLLSTFTVKFVVP